MELYTDSTEALRLQIWYNQEPATSEASVSVSIFDQSGTLVDSGTADGPDDDLRYSYMPPTSLLDSDATLTVKWEYTVGGTILSKTDVVKVVTPYVLPEEFTSAFPGFAGIPYQSLRDMERSVRYAINAFCGQEFTLEVDKTYSASIGGGSQIYLPKRLVRIRSAFTGYFDVSNYVHVDSTGFLLSYPNMNGWVDVKADIGLPGSPNVFSYGGQIYIRGDWGWASVPHEVQHAAKLLMARYLEPESEWHRNRVEAVNMSDHTVRFTGNPYASTGDIQVDQILEGYKLFQPGAV